MKRVEFLGTAGSGKTSIYQSLEFHQTVFGSREDLVLFVSRCIFLESSPLLGRICGALPQSVFDWYVKKRNSRSVVLESALREEHCILSGTIYRCLTDDIDRKKVRPEPLRARCALLLAGEKYSYTKIPVFDEGLLGCIKDLESHYFENALDKLLGVVHVDSDPFSLLCGLKNRAVAGNLKGARRLNERTEQETLELLDSRLQRNRYKKMALVERGIPVVTVNYHAAPVVAKRQANDFLGSLDAAN